MQWKDLTFWNSGEYQVVQENLRDLDKAHIPWCPGKPNLFRALDLCSFADVRVVLIGQDPYPDPAFATGAAFSIPRESKVFPPTLAMICQELAADLEGFRPKHGDLTGWCRQGILLWNAIPSCEAGKSKSHDWPEWECLTKEIIEKLCKEQPGVVFVFLGSTAARFEQFVDAEWHKVILTSHPSPRGNMNSRTPFLGSRLFSTINANLAELGHEAIEWRRL